MEREPVQDQAASEKDQFVIATNELLEPNYFEVVIDQDDVAGDGTMEGGQGAVDCADPLDDPNPNAAALQDFDPFIDSPPSECRNSPVLAPAKIDDSRKWASLEIKIADNEIQRIVIQKKIADLEQRIEVLKKENEASKKIVASASSANSTTPSASQVVSVHSLESALAKQVALVEDPYMLNMMRIEQRVTNEGWENVLLVNPKVRVNTQSGVKAGSLAITDDDLELCFKDGRQSFFSCLRRVTLTIFRMEVMKFYSLQGTKGTAKRKPTMHLPDSCLLQFTELAYQIAIRMKGKWRNSKKANANVIDTDVIARRVLSNMLCERRPTFQPEGDANNASSSEDAALANSVL